MCYNIAMIDSEETTEVKNTGSSSIEAQTTDTAEPAPAADLLKTAVKAVAVALSVVMLVLAILTVAMPLSAMRVFNNLGMSERALASGEEYISSHVRDYSDTDELGNYYLLGRSSEPVTDDFIDALDTCITLSDKLMRETARSGDAASAEYFAEKLERYTRMYASLYGIAELNAVKDAANIAAMPFVSMRPYVYSYAHTVIELNYRARTYLHATDEYIPMNYMLYSSNSNGNCVTPLSERSNTFAGRHDKDVATLLAFADYCSALDEYLSVCFENIGVDGGLPEGEGEFTAGGKYHNVQLLKTGREFSLFVTPEDGYSLVYNQLKNFSDYMQAAVDLSAVTAEQMLERLYIIGELNTFAHRMWDMSVIFYYNRYVFGAHSSDVRDEYVAKTCENYAWALYKGVAQTVDGIYDIYRTEYVDFVRGNNEQ